MSTLTTDQFTDTRLYFRQHFEQYALHLPGNTDQQLHQLRKTAMDRLDSLSFPTRRDEEWKYTSVTRLLQPHYADGQSEVSNHLHGSEDFAFPDEIRVPIINGIPHIPENLPEGLSIFRIDEAYRTEKFRDTINHWMKIWTTEETDPFIVLNAALARGGVCIHVSKKAVINQPVHMACINVSGASPIAVHPQLFVIAEPHSELTLIESYQAEKDESLPAAFYNVVNRLHLDQNARIRHIKLQDGHDEAFHINNTRAEQARDSVYSHYAAEIGSRLVRNNLHAIHQGEGVHTDLYGACLVSGKQHVDNHTFIDHALPHCTSNELYKNIISDRGTGVFNGKVIVRQDAQKTNAFQQNSNLLLSDKAVMDSKPQLEIFADDVKCSHGATIGQLDETAVFYLRSRGLSEHAARRLLQVAFLGEVVDHFPSEAVQEAVEKLIGRKMKGENITH